MSYQSNDNLELLSPYRKTLKNLYQAFDDGSKNLGDFLPGIGHCVRLIVDSDCFRVMVLTRYTYVGVFGVEVYF